MTASLLIIAAILATQLIGYWLDVARFKWVSKLKLKRENDYLKKYEQKISSSKNNTK